MCLPENDSGPSTNMAEWLIALYFTLKQSHYCIFSQPNGWIFLKRLRCSTSGLVVTARKWFWSDDKYGRRLPSLINLLIAFLSGLLF